MLQDERDQEAAQETQLSGLQSVLMGSAIDQGTATPNAVRSMAQDFGATKQESRGLAGLLQGGPQGGQGPLDAEDKAAIGEMVSRSRLGFSPAQVAAFGPDATAEQWTVGNDPGVSDALKPERVAQEIGQYYRDQGVPENMVQAAMDQARNALMSSSQPVANPVTADAGPTEADRQMYGALSGVSAADVTSGLGDAASWIGNRFAGGSASRSELMKLLQTEYGS